MRLNVATCQFPVSADIRWNGRSIMRQISLSKERGAYIAHFPEASLSGYVGVNVQSHRDFDWDLLRDEAQMILNLARQLGIWVILGAAHPLTGRHKPHDSLYVISSEGRLVGRYDKMFCAGDRTGRTGDLAQYTPGKHFCVCAVKGIRCGALICHDYRYPELYREYKRRDVRLMSHSYHAGNIPRRRFWAI